MTTYFLPCIDMSACLPDVCAQPAEYNRTWCTHRHNRHMQQSTSRYPTTDDCCQYADLYCDVSVPQCLKYQLPHLQGIDSFTYRGGENREYLCQVRYRVLKRKSGPVYLMPIGKIAHYLQFRCKEYADWQQQSK